MEKEAKMDPGSDDDGEEQIKAMRLGFLSRAQSKDALSIYYKGS